MRSLPLAFSVHRMAAKAHGFILGTEPAIALDQEPNVSLRMLLLKTNLDATMKCCSFWRTWNIEGFFPESQ